MDLYLQLQSNDLKGLSGVFTLKQIYLMQLSEAIHTRPTENMINIVGTAVVVDPGCGDAPGGVDKVPTVRMKACAPLQWPGVSQMNDGAYSLSRLTTSSPLLQLLRGSENLHSANADSLTDSTLCPLDLYLNTADIKAHDAQEVLTSRFRYLQLFLCTSFANELPNQYVR
ncbi:hypothetical protein Mapa_006581 [Marchantia paleacea]|nr:hypothetical protein Mapa_006581 [Marchantia paleacea]